MSDEKIISLLLKVGLCLVTEACAFIYTDAPSSFTIGYREVMLRSELGEPLMRFRVPLDGVALWKGELMFFDGANLAFGCGTSVMTSDFCSN